MLEQLSTRKVGKLINSVLVFTVATLGLAMTSSVAGEEITRVEQGKQIAFDRTLGNCLACHMIEDGALPGNTAPPLIAMKARFADYDRLLQQISNPLAANPNSLMPPFGLHDILTEDEISKVAEYLYTL